MHGAEYPRQNRGMQRENERATAGEISRPWLTEFRARDPAGVLDS